jgi:uncharacterized membrane protein
MALAVYVAAIFVATSIGISELEPEHGGPGILQKWLAFSVSAVFTFTAAGLVMRFLADLIRTNGSYVRLLSMASFLIFFVPLIVGLALWSSTDAFAIQFLSSHAYTLGAGVVASVICGVTLRDSEVGTSK